MGIQAYLLLNGHAVAGLQDPSGGHFDAAGDFDRLIPCSDLPLLSQVDPSNDLELDPASMPGLLAEVDNLLPTAQRGAEERGLLRLRALAQACADRAGSTLVFRGD